MKRAGRLNCALSFLLTVLVAWYIAASIGSRATISAFTALAAALCGFTGGWIGWRTSKAHKRQTPLRQVRFAKATSIFRPVSRLQTALLAREPLLDLDKPSKDRCMRPGCG